MSKTIRKKKGRLARVHKKAKAELEADRPEMVLVELKNGVFVRVALRLK